MVANTNYKPSTFTQLYIHVVFAVKFRNSLLNSTVQDGLHAHIASTLIDNGHKPLAIGGMPDHLHVLFGLNPNQSISDIVKEMKRITSTWLNESHFYRCRFYWQEGYGAFSYSRSQIDNVIKYILNQPRHHLHKTFLEEYTDTLSKFGVAFNENFIFHEPV